MRPDSHFVIGHLVTQQLAKFVSTSSWLRNTRSACSSFPSSSLWRLWGLLPGNRPELTPTKALWSVQGPGCPGWAALRGRRKLLRICLAMQLAVLVTISGVPQLNPQCQERHPQLVWPKRWWGLCPEISLDALADSKSAILPCPLAPGSGSNSVAVPAANCSTKSWPVCETTYLVSQDVWATSEQKLTYKGQIS